jgi:hypothetical protein
MELVMEAMRLLIAQTEAPRSDAVGGMSSTALGLIFIGVVIVLVAVLAFMLGRRGRAKRVCPRCRGELRGRFCPTCGMEAKVES